MQPSPIDPVAAAEFIVRRLYRPLRFADAACFAAAETEHPFAGDTWFWTDDNAKIVELLARPELCRRYARETDEVLRFLRLMCRGPLILRRVGSPRLLLTGQDGSELSFYHSLMHLRCDLSRGVVVAGIRFHDNRTADNLLFHTNCVEFTHRKRRYSVPVEEAIDDFASDLDGHRLELRYAAELRFKPRRQELRVGRISYRYSIDARSMVIGVEAALEVDPGADISDVELTIAQDYLSHGLNGVRYSHIFAGRPEGEPLRFTAQSRGRQKLPVAGCDYYSIVQQQIAGFALAAHTAPREPQRLAELEVLVREPGFLHFVRARYRFGGGCRGRRLVAAENKMLTAGGFYRRVEDYRRLLHDAAAALGVPHETAIDYSVSYDYGAELNAFAHYFVALGQRGCGATLRDEAKSLFDACLATYFDLFVSGHQRGEDTIFSRQLAFVVLSLVTMHRATGSADYRHRLGELCEVLLEFEKRFDDVAGAAVSGILMGVHSQRIVFVDCHSAALFALAQAAEIIADARFAAVIDRGLGCYSIETIRIDWHDGPHKADAIAVAWLDDGGTRHTNHGFWNYHAGLMLRLFAALRRTPDPSLQAVAARHRDRIELFELMIRHQITHSLASSDSTVEIRSSVLSTETNSETQPWAALGLIEAADDGE
ncbi:MAG TPA: hypothetical protein VKQ73_12555 [Stellaceae bacterium]|nr:hypothetical protein [Stellaceae bacterium]